MAQIACKVSDGLRPAEVTVMVEDIHGHPEFFPADREFLMREGTNYYLPVGLIFVDDAKKAALVSLPYEADSGANRLWVKLDNLHQPSEASL
jgi:hypothetical protein